MLHQREQRAKELKDGADHSAKMNDRQLDDLRSQIRVSVLQVFVSLNFSLRICYCFSASRLSGVSRTNLVGRHDFDVSRIA